jgi:hypothetical protein
MFHLQLELTSQSNEFVCPAATLYPTLWMMCNQSKRANVYLAAAAHVPSSFTARCMRRLSKAKLTTYKYSRASV